MSTGKGLAEQHDDDQCRGLELCGKAGDEAEHKDLGPHVAEIREHLDGRQRRRSVGAFVFRGVHRITAGVLRPFPTVSFATAEYPTSNVALDIAAARLPY